MQGPPVLVHWWNCPCYGTACTQIRRSPAYFQFMEAYALYISSSVCL